MGMFDEVCFKCPDCEFRVNVQSKAGKCDLKSYNSLEVPVEIANDIDGDVIFCENCGCRSVVASLVPIKTVPMRLIP